MGKVLSTHHLKGYPVLICKTFPVGDTLKVVCEKGSVECKDFETSPAMTLYSADENMGIWIKDPIDFGALGKPIEVQ